MKKNYVTLRNYNGNASTEKMRVIANQKNAIKVRSIPTTNTFVGKERIIEIPYSADVYVSRNYRSHITGDCEFHLVHYQNGKATYLFNGNYRDSDKDSDDIKKEVEMICFIEDLRSKGYNYI